MPDEGSSAVRRAGAADADEVIRLLHAAGRRLLEQGYANWDPPYPRDRVVADLATREVYLIGNATGPAAATFTLGELAARPYDPEPWVDVRAPALYLNRLAVDPALQGVGVGGGCLRTIADLARRRGVGAVRCEVLAINARLRALYERHGYVARGERSHSGWMFASYEWIVSPNAPPLAERR